MRMAREHKMILLFVLWAGIIVACLTMLFFQPGGRWVTNSILTLAVGLGIACLVIIALPAPKSYPIGFCSHCGYDLTGNQSGRCSECGSAFPDASSNQHAGAS